MKSSERAGWAAFAALMVFLLGFIGTAFSDDDVVPPKDPDVAVPTATVASDGQSIETSAIPPATAGETVPEAAPETAPAPTETAQLPATSEPVPEPTIPPVANETPTDQSPNCEFAGQGEPCTEQTERNAGQQNPVLNGEPCIDGLVVINMNFSGEQDRSAGTVLEMMRSNAGAALCDDAAPIPGNCLVAEFEVAEGKGYWDAVGLETDQVRLFVESAFPDRVRFDDLEALPLFEAPYWGDRVSDGDQWIAIVIAPDAAQGGVFGWLGELLAATGGECGL